LTTTAVPAPAAAPFDVDAVHTELHRRRERAVEAYVFCSLDAAQPLIAESETPTDIAIAATMSCYRRQEDLKAATLMMTSAESTLVAMRQAEVVAREAVIAFVVSARAKMRKRLRQQDGSAPLRKDI